MHEAIFRECQSKLLAFSAKFQHQNLSFASDDIRRLNRYWGWECSIAKPKERLPIYTRSVEKMDKLVNAALGISVLHVSISRDGTVDVRINEFWYESMSLHTFKKNGVEFIEHVLQKMTEQFLPKKIPVWKVWKRIRATA